MSNFNSWTRSRIKIFDLLNDRFIWPRVVGVRSCILAFCGWWRGTSNHLKVSFNPEDNRRLLHISPFLRFNPGKIRLKKFYLGAVRDFTQPFGVRSCILAFCEGQGIFLRFCLLYGPTHALCTQPIFWRRSISFFRIVLMTLSNSRFLSDALLIKNDFIFLSKYTGISKSV